MRDEKSLTDCIMSISETVRRGFFSVIGNFVLYTRESVFYGALESYIWIKRQQNAQNEFAQYYKNKSNVQDNLAHKKSKMVICAVWRCTICV